MTYFVTWETTSKIPLQERVGPFLYREAAVREVDFVLSDPRIKVRNINIEEEERE